MNLLFYFLEFLEGEILSLLHEIDDEVDEQLPTSQQEKDPALLVSNDSAPFRRLKGRRRAVNVKLMNELRIVKRDIRRRYIGMYNNVMNVHDHSLLLSFLRDLCTPSCSFTVRLPHNHRGSHVWRGVQEIFLQMAHSQLRIPDGVQQLGDGRIHVSLGKPGSRIISSVSFRGTLMFKSRQGGEGEVELGKPPQPQLSSHSSSLCPSRSFERFPFDLFPPLSQASQPKEIKASGVCTMILDEMNRIESFLMDFHDFYEEEISSQS